MAVQEKFGVFTWNELLTNDVQASKDFYTKLLGWQAEDMPMEEGSYTIFKIGEEQVCGLMQLPPQAAEMGAPPYWGSYISVEDVDAVASAVEAMGGKVLAPPMDAEGVGRFATFMDPQGAVFSVIQNAK